MSQLKADLTFVFGEECLAYKKSEADKVIAELKTDYKEACDRLQTANLIKDEQLAATRHQKYKRCLAMASNCALHKSILKVRNLLEDYPAIMKIRIDKIVWWEKWCNRWLELAEKLKEAKW